MKRSKLQGSTLVFALILLLTTIGSGLAQNKPTQPGSQLHTRNKQQVDPKNEFRESFIKASEDYKASLQALLVLYENDFKKRLEESAKLKELYTDGLISRLEYEKTTNDITAA